MEKRAWRLRHQWTVFESGAERSGRARAPGPLATAGPRPAAITYSTVAVKHVTVQSIMCGMWNVRARLRGLQ